MENASKALLIAGAVLLVIAIIAIGMGIFRTGRNVTDNTKGQIDNMSVQMHNKQFEGYEGIGLKYENIKECITQIATNNSNINNSEFKVKLNIKYYSNPAHDITDYFSSVEDVQSALTTPLLTQEHKYKLYDCKLQYNENGIISEITIINYWHY